MVMDEYHSTCAYKLFLPTDNQVVINIDIEFYERKIYNWLQNPQNVVQEGDSLSHIKTNLHDEEHVTPAEHTLT